jgi:GDP-L-fucose synthase
MNKDSRIYVAGHRGMVGSAIVRKLQSEGYLNLVTRTHAELDLTRQAEVERFFQMEKPENVFVAAARVGGILTNSTYTAEFLYENLQIQTNLIHSAFKAGVKKLLFLGSSCIYPRDCPQPMKEEYLLTGPLEPTNEAYAIAKIAGIQMCRFYHQQYGADFLSVMPCNLYGPGDNFDLESSHVLPALIRKFHEAKTRALRSELGDQEPKGREAVTIWGTGSPLREFLHVDDMADACVFVMRNISAPDIYGKGISHLNVGAGQEISIKDLALLIRDIVGFKGEINHDLTKPDGMPRKLLDVSRLTGYGWQRKISLAQGIRQVYDWYTRTLA